MKKLSVVLVLLLLVALLTGCAGSAQQKAPSVTNITVWTYYNGAQLTTFNALVDQFNATVGQEKGIVVETSSQGSVSELEDNVLAAANGKVGVSEMPNIFAAYADTAYTIDQMGLAADLRPYFSDEDLGAYVDSYVQEGHFSAADSMKIFPVAKSVEVFMLNRTDWQAFAQATGATYDDFSTIEGLTATAKAYYEWTDSLTPQPDDGKAFFGRDAMANYMLIGAMQMGCEIFTVEDGRMTLHFDREIARRLWDNYYIPYVMGYYAASGRFRSDDVKTGNILAYVGSSSSATFFPSQVSTSDTESHDIEVEVLPCPQFAGAVPCAVQQGAGMVVMKAEPEKVQASVEFLKWFTAAPQNILFSVGSGYLPVQKANNQMTAILAVQDVEITPLMEQVLTIATQTVNDNVLYTPRAFSGGAGARKVLEYAMSDLAIADRDVVEARLAEGQSLADATAEFITDAYFEAWYQQTLGRLQHFAG